MTHLPRTNRAFTLVELVVGMAIVAILAALSLPALARTRSSAQRMGCSNNLRQVGLSFRTWAAAHGGKTPMMESEYGGGTFGSVGYRVLSGNQNSSRGVCKMFLCLSNELTTPKLLFCPAEYESSLRQAATTFAGTVPPGANAVPYTNDLNVSYFIGVDAQEACPRMLLTGDHSLGSGNPPTVPYLSAPSVGSAFVSLGTNFPANNTAVGWMDNMHAKQGNVGMADGSVEWFSRSNLQNALKNSGDRGRAAGTFAAAPGCSPAGVNRIQLP